MTLDSTDIPVLLAILCPFGATIAYIVRLEMRVKQLEKPKNNGENPIAVLKMRLSKGEITLEEYEKILKKIS